MEEFRYTPEQVTFNLHRTKGSNCQMAAIAPAKHPSQEMSTQLGFRYACLPHTINFR